MSSTNRAAAAPATAGQQGDQAGRTDWKWTIGRAVLMYVGISVIANPSSPIGSYVGKLMGREPPAPPPSDASNLATPSSVGSSASDSTPLLHTQTDDQAAIRLPTDIAIPAWPQESLLDFYVYISSAPAPDHLALKTQQSDLLPESGVSKAPAVPFDAFKDLEALLEDPLRSDVPPSVDPVIIYAQGGAAAMNGQPSPIAAIKWSNIGLGDLSLSRDADLLLPLDEQVRRHNASIWADLIVTQRGVNPNPASATYSPFNVYRSRKMLTRLMPLKRKRAEKNLFDKDGRDKSQGKAAEIEAAEEEAAGPAPIVGHWHRNLTVAIVQDAGNPGVQINQIPPPVLQHVSVLRDPATGEMVPAPNPPRVPAGNAAAAVQRNFVLRYPTVFPNDFWLLKEHMHPINETVTSLPLHVSLYHQTWFKFQVLASMTDSFDKQAGGVTGGELDMVKTMLLETNPWFLALTITVSLLHSLFEFLAFSSDVSHWRNKDNLAGVSVGSILTNVVVQLIITLYLLDNNEDTSWMILAGQAIGVLIECWKLTKAVTVGLKRAPPGSWIPYRLKIEDKHVLSEEEKQTQEYDRLAFKYVGFGVGPLLVAYTIYSALYQTHRGWWSFIISTATSFVYAFGFVSLIPQLIVNYKLKSTAGMNTKTFVYKILGTFVDDLFAFCIKMPTLHRLACFRDDIVFFIFLYQRWKYGVDPTRRNEFGQVVDKKESDKKDADKPDTDQSAPLTEPEKGASTAIDSQPTSLRERAAPKATSS
ncbi:CLPTM1-domain-containing protein [Testicularia cyperi]|uniref:CLPTM1-domain-containing protein n=1 Tax=Testicularia cyperi TaxID=1882483 RepID=A0A317XVN6_9BASI|nr:CLPTM1-domain-containing protein [Testicularia cyperi]